jgi:hypothetical protein
LFTHLLKFFIRTDKLKKEDSEIKTSGAGDGQANEPENDYGRQNKNIANVERSS